MINSKNLKFILIPLSILTLVYMFMEIPFVLEFLWLGYGLISLNFIVNGFRFKTLRKEWTTLGKVENFNGELVSVLYTFLFVAIFAYLGTKLTDWGLVAKRSTEISPYFLLIIILPQFVQAIMIYVLNAGGQVYLTEQGIVLSMNISERYVWNDLDSYAVLPDLKLIRFRKEKGKKTNFLFVSTDDDDFEQKKDQILAILDENLKREIG